MPDVILSNLAAATTPLTGTERIPMDQRVGGTIAATALTPGLGYAIVTVGTTNWATCGVPAGVTPVVGLVFTCQAVGTGTGTAQQVETVDAAASDVAALAGSAIAAAVAAHQAAADPHSIYTTEAEVNAIIAALTHLDVSITGAVTQHVRNDSGATMAAGTPYHVVGAVGDTSRMRVIAARADDPATMPANGILQQTLTATGGGADGHGVVGGVATGFNTAGGTEGATIWVGLTGGISLTRPATNPQPIGALSRVHASTGSVAVAIGPVLHPVAFSGAYGDLSGRPLLGTAAPLDVASTGNASAAQVVKGDDTRLSDSRPPLAHSQAASTISDSTAVGRALVTAVDAPAARSAISAEQAGAASAAVAAHASSVTPVHSASQISGLLSDANPQNHAATAAAGTAASASRADHVHQFQPSDVVIPLSAPAGNVVTGEAENLVWPRATVLTAIPVWSVKTAPAGSAMQFDIRVGGTSIFSTLPTIAIGGTTSSATTPAVFSAAFVSGGQTIAAGSLVTFHVTQIGSSTAGAGLKVAMPTRRAA